MTPTPPLGDPGPVVLREVSLAIDPAEVRAFQAAKPPLPLPPGELPARLAAARTEIAGLVDPRVGYRTLGVTAAEPDALALADGTRFRIPGIGRHWGPVEAVVAGLVTVGDAPEARVRARHAAGDALGATLLDSAASAAVECLAEWANDHVCRLGVAARLRATNRISPGVAGWDLAEHPALVALAPAGDLGVRLDAGGRLAPAKSISFLMGIGRAARVDHYFVQCRRCWVERCPARRTAAVAMVDRGAAGPAWAPQAVSERPPGDNR